MGISQFEIKVAIKMLKKNDPVDEIDHFMRNKRL